MKGENDTDVAGTIMHVIYRKLQYNSSLGLNRGSYLCSSFYCQYLCVCVCVCVMNTRINVLML